MALVCDQCQYENKDDALLCNLCGKIFRKASEPVVREPRPATPEEKRAREWLAEGIARGSQGQFPRALACMEKALELDPSLALAWHLKAGALEKLGRNDEALVSQERAVELEPGNPTHWHWKGVHLKKLRRFEEAVAAYDRALALEPNQPGYWSDRGLSLATLGRSAEAIDCYVKAIALAPEAAPPWYNKALEEDRLGKVPEAIESFRNFLRFAAPAMVPQIEQAKVRLAELERRDTTDFARRASRLFDEKRYEEAVEYLDEALFQDADNVALWTLRGDCMRELGFAEDSAACYERAFAESSANSVRHTSSTFGAGASKP